MLHNSNFQFKNIENNPLHLFCGIKKSQRNSIPVNSGFLLLFLLISLLCAGVCPAQAPTNLTTELLEHTDRVFLDGYPADIPLDKLKTAVERYRTAAIRSPKPYFGWIVNSNKYNTLQTAYRVLVATSPKLLAQNEADMWDSNKTASDNSSSVRYEGKPLQESTVYYWKVKIWDNYETESDFSQVKSFITADTFDEATPRYPLQITDEYPVKIKYLGDSHTFIDFGKDAFGKLKLTLSSDKETDTVIIRLGECLKNGLIDRKPGGTIRYAEYRLPLMAGIHTYAIKIRPDGRNTNMSAGGSGAHPILMPDYTGEVYPFRYCEIENYSHKPVATNVVRQMVHYPFNETVASFHSSDTVLNQVWDLCKYSIKATSFTGTYIDGDRERIPYEADALINQLTHYSVDREYAIARHSHEHLIKHATWPTEWILTSVLIAWYDYLYTGNPASLHKYYEDLKHKTLMGLKESNGLISSTTGKQTPELLKSIYFQNGKLRDIVDWPHSGILGLGKNEGGETDGFVFKDYNTVVNAYHYEALKLIGKIAESMGKTADRNFYAREAEYVKSQINRLLFDKDKGYYNDGIGTDHSSLHANVFPLAFGIVSHKNAASVMNFIRSRGMAAMFAAPALVEAVYEAHDAEYGLQLLSSTAERSWYNMIRVGSTISLESWDNKYKPNQDWNHASGAAAAYLIARRLMGIEPLEPGFRKIRIKPQPATLQQANIRIPSVKGAIGVSFDNLPGKKFSLDAEIPANAVAEIWLPKLSTKYKLKVNGVSQKGVVEGDFIIVRTGSGKYTFTVEK
ncbi:MAG: family 78 glycoside hydrolase catalytic domain [Prevotellaceae bacterium]|nr:family 78 glycoside hydrolase catalytic domain [Prevotellaceae bacterium]